MVAREATSPTATGVMTLKGTSVKAGVLSLLILGSALYIYFLLIAGYAQFVYPLFIIGLIGGLIVGIVTRFKMNWSPVTAPMYAMLEGFVLGTISVIAEAYLPGIVLQAVLLTFCVLGAMLICYYTGAIKPTENLKLGLAAAMGGIFMFYMLTWILSFFGRGLTAMFFSGPLGIGISLFIIGIAALNLVVDFDFIEQGVDRKAPKYMEWYAAFGLMVTLVWLYIEILRFLMIVAGNRR